VDLLELSMTPMSEPSPGDGTQIWKITHNGVDTHTIHFHLFNVQLLNRVAWDNALRVPDANELGWKETVRVSPLQDTIVAMRPVTPTQSFSVPNSIRPIDPTMPLGATLTGMVAQGFQDPAGNPVPVVNHLVNYGWEYVIHCHLLGHEEMDMMHSMVIGARPGGSPTNLAAGYTPGRRGVNLTWTDNAVNETHFTVERATVATGPWTIVGRSPSSTGPTVGATAAYTDTTVERNTTYYYRVLGTNVVGDTTEYADPAIGFPQLALNTGPSNEVTITTTGAPAAPVNLVVQLGQPFAAVRTAQANASVTLTWSDNANSELSFRVERSPDSTFASYVTKIDVAPNPANGVTSFTDTIVNGGAALARNGTTYYYRVFAVNEFGDSAPSNVVSITIPAGPVLPYQYNFPCVGKQ
jgi:hypothetical protein